jgi:hypothetical protein
METKKFLTIGLMIKKSPILYTIVLFLGCSYNNKYKEVLEDFDIYPYSYYVSLNTSDGKQNMKIVIEIAELSHLLMTEEGITQSMCYEQIKKVLNNNIPLIVNKHTFILLKNYQVIPTKKINQLKDKGINYLIQSLFNKYGALITPLSEIDKKYVIDILFQNDMFTMIDDESGYVYIPSFNKVP